MHEDTFTEGATHNYTLITKPGKLTEAAPLAILRALGFDDSQDTMNPNAPPPTTRIINNSALSLHTNLSYESVTHQLQQIANEMNHDFPTSPLKTKHTVLLLYSTTQTSPHAQPTQLTTTHKPMENH